MTTSAERRLPVRSDSSSGECSGSESESDAGATRIRSAIVQTSVGRRLDLSPPSNEHRRPSSSPPDRRKRRAPSRSPSEERRSHTPPRSPPGRGRRRRRRRSSSPSPPPRSRSPSANRAEESDETPPPKKKKEELDPILTRTGGAYIPPARLRLMQQSITDKSSVAYQRLSWEALKKSINGLINKVNVANIGNIVQELFQENVVRGRGVLARSLVQAQAASPTFTHVYAALVSIINTKFPQTGELIAKRLMLQFQKGFRRNDKNVCMTAVKFLAHLVNQQVLHELVALELLTLLLEEPSDDSVEVSIGFLKESGQKLTEVSPRGVHAVFETLRSILHSGKITPRIQYMIEVLFAVRKDNFKEHPAVVPELDLVQEADQITHLLSLGDEFNSEDTLNVFQVDPDFAANEEKYKTLKAEILGEESSSGGSEESGESEEEDSEEEDDVEQQQLDMMDMTDAKVTTLRRTIYLTIMSSLDYEECAHKMLKSMEEGQEREIANMVIECCSQERSYLRFYGLLGQRFCQLNQAWVEQFDDAFQQQYATVHRLETNKLRNVAKFFGQLFYADALPWTAMACIHLNEDETNSSSRIFVKILFQELSEFMGLSRLNERLKDPILAMAFEGILPRDNPKNSRFAINFFTSIGLGGLTDDLREHLKNTQKMIMAQKQAVSSSDTDSSDNDDDSNSSESSSDTEGSSESSSSEDEKPRHKKKQRAREKERGREDRKEKDSRKRERSRESGHRSKKDKHGGKREEQERRNGDERRAKKKSHDAKRQRGAPDSPDHQHRSRDGDRSPLSRRERDQPLKRNQSPSLEYEQRRQRDPSPPREREYDQRRQRDRSPPREREYDQRRQRDSSPPREREYDQRRQRDTSPPREKENDRRRQRDSSPPREREYDQRRQRDRSPPKEKENDRRRQRDSSPSREGEFDQKRQRDRSPPRDDRRRQRDSSPSREGEFDQRRQRDRSPPRDDRRRQRDPSPSGEREFDRRRQRDRSPPSEKEYDWRKPRDQSSPSPPRMREYDRRRQRDPSPSGEREFDQRRQRDRSPPRDDRRRQRDPSPSGEREFDRRRQRDRSPPSEKEYDWRKPRDQSSPSPPRKREYDRRRQRDLSPSREREYDQRGRRDGDKWREERRR